MGLNVVQDDQINSRLCR